MIDVIQLPFSQRSVEILAYRKLEMPRNWSNLLSQERYHMTGACLLAELTFWECALYESMSVLP